MKRGTELGHECIHCCDLLEAVFLQLQLEILVEFEGLSSFYGLGTGCLGSHQAKIFIDNSEKVIDMREYAQG